jgi:hypothetical protein
LQKSYLVKSPINFADFGFFVRIGDLLVHDPLNHDKLTVYRNGEIIKSITQTSLGVLALLKNDFISEVGPPFVPKVKIPSSAEVVQKRGKAVPRESTTDDPVFRERMGLKAGESIESPLAKAAEKLPISPPVKEHVKIVP